MGFLGDLGKTALAVTLLPVMAPLYPVMMVDEAMTAKKKAQGTTEKNERTNSEVPDWAKKQAQKRRKR